MIGYGFLNSKIHEFCIKGILISFFERSLFFAYFYYDSFIRNNNVKKIEELEHKDIKEFFDLFMIEERIINRIPDGANNLKDDFTFHKYFILSSNIIKNKDYDFNGKSEKQIIEEGIKNFKIIFLETFQEFLISLKDSKVDEVTFTAKIEEIHKAVVKLTDEEVDYVKETPEGMLPQKELPTNTLNETENLFIKSIFSSNVKYEGKHNSIIQFYRDSGFLKLEETLMKILEEQINALET